MSPHEPLLLAQATARLPSFLWLLDLSSIFWLVFGIVLCTAEFCLPAKFAQKHRLLFLFPGFIALLVAVFSLRYSPFSLELFGVQVFELFQFQMMYWMLVSTACVIWVRPMILPKKRYQLHSSAEAKTTTAILPGEIGRVQYEGCSWPAYCENGSDAIAANQVVYVLRQEGNTLVVAPKTLFQIER